MVSGSPLKRSVILSHRGTAGLNREKGKEYHEPGGPGKLDESRGCAAGQCNRSALAIRVLAVPVVAWCLGTARSKRCRKPERRVRSKFTQSWLEWRAAVYFAGRDDFPMNVVGRLGFLDRLRVGIVDYEQILYLAVTTRPNDLSRLHRWLSRGWTRKIRANYGGSIEEIRQIWLAEKRSRRHQSGWRSLNPS
jgi:hypothetical protein